MQSLKKVDSSFFLLMMLIVRLGLNPDVQVNRWPLARESRSVFLGPTSAYTQTSPLLSFSERFPHPKSLESNELDEATILFSRLNYYNTLRLRDSDCIACIANSAEAEQNSQTQLDSHGSSDNSSSSFEDHALQNGNSIQAINARNERDLPLRFDNVELSAEDMDLIEILWKQDIDLGVSREAYDSRSSLDVEKLKEYEIKKEKDIYNPPDNETIHEDDLVPNPLTGLNYTIDSETGEYLTDDTSPLVHFGNGSEYPENEKYLLKENETLGALSQDTYLPFGDDDEFCDLSNVFSPIQLSDLLSDSDYLSRIEDLEKELEQIGTFNDSSGNNATATEMYPNMEDCWSDTTTMLPILALSSSHQPLGPLTSHPMHNYTTLNNSIPLPSGIQNRPTESFMGMLQNASLDVPPPEEFQATSIASSVCPSSIGCAVVESMATLANDTDPIPTSSIINSVYNTEFPDMMYTNHTVAAPHNEILISDLLLDEDLHLSHLCASSQEKQNEYHMDTSNDSISLTSGQLPSVSDYESDSRCFSDIPFENGNCNEPPYFNKYPDVSDSCGSKLSFKKFEYNVPKPSGVSSSNFIHHNHSYHVPFNTEDSQGKPVTRDKSKSSEDEASNKDEKRAKELKLPISINDIINLAIDEYNERLSKYELTEAQLTLIRDIRRRGKNKVAAQNCRKRKMDQICSLQQDLSFLQREKLQLRSKQNHLIREKLHFKDKYAQLYEYVLQSSTSKPPNPPDTLSSHSNSGAITVHPELISEDDTDLTRSTRTKRKYKK